MYSSMDLSTKFPEAPELLMTVRLNICSECNIFTDMDMGGKARMRLLSIRHRLVHSVREDMQ